MCVSEGISVSQYVLGEDFLKMSVCEICVKLGRVLIKDLVHIYTKPDQILELPAIVLHTGPHRTQTTTLSTKTQKMVLVW